MKHRTELGVRLWQARLKIIASGLPMLDRAQLDRETVERQAEPLPEDQQLALSGASRLPGLE